jgi:hypothetical protein
MRGLGILLAGLPGIAVLAFPADTEAYSCEMPPCCFADRNGAGNLSTTLAEVVSLRFHGASLKYLGAPVYCSDGVECPGEGMPVEVSWDAEVCHAGCYSCASLAIGTRGLVVVNRANGCLLEMIPVDDLGVLCGLPACKALGLASALELSLATDEVCLQAYLEMGYCLDPWEEPCEEEGTGCAHTGGAGSVGLACAIGLGWLTFRRRRA